MLKYILFLHQEFQSEKKKSKNNDMDFLESFLRVIFVKDMPGLQNK